MSAPIAAKSMSTALSRVDGRRKVTGGARYPAEFNPPNVAYAFAVMSPISNGTITAIDSAGAEKAAGVLAVLTHLNAPKLAEPPNDQKHEGIRIEQREPLADNKISYGGQYIAAIVAHAFGLTRENVRVICPFVGGAFGCKGPVWPHTILAAMAAKVVRRPVKLELTRHNMFSGTGHRTPTLQTIALAAIKDGKLQAIRHRSEMLTSPVGDWVEGCGIGSTNVLYDAPAIEFNHIVHTVNVSQPSFMRAPGECPGTYALECAMDELAYALKMDPLKLRTANDSANHPIKGVPWSTKHLRECYELGAREFGWSKRTHEPRSMKDGHLLVGWGVATATYPAHAGRAEVKIQFKADGTAIAKCAAHDLGTGQWTSLTQISADAIGVPVERVKFELGDSDLPFGPVAGGSQTTATVGSGIALAAADLKKKLVDLGADANKPETYAEALKIKEMDSIEGDGLVKYGDK